MAANLTLLRRGFVDICNGYSVGRTKTGDAVYIRHLGHRNHAGYEEAEAAFQEAARALGAQSEVERLDQLYAKGLWSPAREAEIATKRMFITQLEEGRKTIAVPSVLRSHEEHIAREREGLVKTLNERARVLGMTVETYASRRLEDHYLVHNLFVDRELTKQLYAPDAFDNLEDAEVDAVHEVYKAAIEPCSDANLRRLAVQDFFSSYWSLAGDNPQAFYGRPICELTYYQVRLASIARYMKGLLDNVNLSALTPEQRTDPDVLEQKLITQRNMDKMREEGKTPIAMSASDIKETGTQFSPLPPAGISGVDLVRWMQRNQKLAR